MGGCFLNASDVEVIIDKKGKNKLKSSQPFFILWGDMGRREEQRATAREKIIRAASQCFAEKGYATCTLKDIAEAAGMSKGALYIYYSAKKDLFIDIMDIQYKIAIDKSLLAAKMKPHLDGIIWFMKECIRDCGFPMDHKLWAEIVAVVSRDDDIKKHFIISDMNLRNVFLGLINEAASCGEINSKLDLDATVLWLTSLANGLILRIADDPNFDFEQNFQSFEQLVRNALNP